MARIGKGQIRNRQFQLSVGGASLLAAGLISVSVSAQTVVIGGSGSRPVTVNLGAISGGHSPVATSRFIIAPASSLSQGQGGTDYSKSATIQHGDEVIKLVPPGSRPKPTPKPKKVQKPKPAPAVAKIEPKDDTPPTVAKEPEATKQVVTAEVEAEPAQVPVKKAEAAKAPEPSAPKNSPEPKAAAPAEPKVAEKPAEPVKEAETASASDAPSETQETVTETSPSDSPKKITPDQSTDTAVAANTPAETAAPTQSTKAAEPSQEKDMQVAAVAPETIKTPNKTLEKSESLQSVSSAELQSILFEEGETTLPSSASSTLQDLAAAIEGKSDRIQLVAFANASSNGTARRLSLGRALVIRSKLMELGVPNNKIEVRALGKPNDGSPADRVDLKMVTR